MSFLLKNEIKSLALTEGLLGSNFEEGCLQSCSYDLRVGAVFKDHKIISLDSNPNSNWDIAIKPSEIITMMTLEEVNLPKHICATVFPINKWSSTGLLILNPGHIDPGYKGAISICAVNLSKETKYLQVKKTKIFTILFHWLSGPAEGYKNNEELLASTRKEKEQHFFINKARTMSSSIFDLILENEYKPFLQKIVDDSIRQQLYKIVAKFVGAIVILATILGTIYAALAYYSGSSEKQSRSNSRVDTFTKPMNTQEDTVGLYKHVQDLGKGNATKTIK
jgi:deoxycytidine triphosphate deaminase